MIKKFWTISEVIEIFEVERRLLSDLEEEDILCSCVSEEATERGYRSEEMDTLRLVKILMDDLDVNLSGVDIILRMRRQMIDMRQQFDAILEDLAEKLREEP